MMPIATTVAVSGPAIASPAPTPAPDQVVLDDPRGVRVTLESSVDGLVAVPVMIGGAGPFRFLLDTGGDCEISPRVAAAGRVHAIDRGGRRYGPTGSPSPVLEGIVAELSIGGVRLRRIPTIVDEIAATGYDGIIGYPLFARLLTRIDVRGHTLTVGPLAGERDDATIPVRFAAGHLPVVEARMGGVAAPFGIDTGSNVPLWLGARFALAHGYPLHSTRTASLHIGTVDLGVVAAYAAPDDGGSSGWTDVAGSIGLRALEPYALLLDYPHARIGLLPER